MKETDERWVNNWSRRYHKPVFDSRFTQRWGTNTEPEASIWLSSMSEPMGEFFTEGLKILDYGCGGGRYANFISQRIKDFTYYGIEPNGGESAIAIEELKNHRLPANVRFGYITDEIEKEAIDTVDVVALGSIFTHLVFETDDESPNGDSFVTICDKFKPVIDRGGIIVFSVFIDDVVRTQGGAGAYGILRCYGWSYYTLEVMNDYCEKRGLKITEGDNFLAQEVNDHRIFRMEKK
jgi:SAM-dependent methyltransferase